MKSIIVASLMVLSSVAASHAQTENPAWLDDLQVQLAEEQECEVALFIKVTEDKLGGRTLYSARAQCVDGRQFDASRKEGDSTFVIKACDVAVC